MSLKKTPNTDIAKVDSFHLSIWQRSHKTGLLRTSSFSSSKNIIIFFIIFIFLEHHHIHHHIHLLRISSYSSVTAWVCPQSLLPGSSRASRWDKYIRRPGESDDGIYLSISGQEGGREQDGAGGLWRELGEALLGELPQRGAQHGESHSGRPFSRPYFTLALDLHTGLLYNFTL